MKHLTAALVGFALAFTLALSSHAGPETVMCVLNMPADGGYTDTSCILADAGTCGVGFCTWKAGANVMLQCTADVYVDQDGADPSSADIFVDFTNNKDPYTLNLGPGQEKIAVELVTPATGQTCRFAPTLRKKPW